MPLSRPPPPARAAGRPDPALPLLQRAVAAFNAGRWAEAEGLARGVLALRPDDPSALNILGGAAMNTGRADEGILLLERAIRGQPNNPFIAFNLGEALRRGGRPREAVAAFQRALRANPDFAEASAQLGEALRSLDRWDEAEAAYERALSLRPVPVAWSGLAFLAGRKGRLDLAVERLNHAARMTPAPAARGAVLATLAGVLLEAGDQPQGLEALSEAVELAPDPAHWRMLGRALAQTRVIPSRPVFRDQLLALFDRADVNPRSLATASLALLRRDVAFAELLGEVPRASPTDEPILDLAGAATSRLLDDALFRALLVSAPIPDVAAELLLTRVRRDLLLQSAGGHPSAPDDLERLCALAQQCFLNEYVYALTPEEAAAECWLRADMAAAAGPPDWRTAAILACYRPLDEILTLEPWPENAPAALSPVWRQQVEEPRRERAFARALPQLRPLRDETSKAVQAQYEANPYPRWTRCHLGVPTSLKAAVQAALPHLGPGEAPDIEAPDILIAGCGTGLETMRVVSTYRGAKVLALDLSLASLAYGQRKLTEYGVTSVKAMQGDILDLGSLDRTFDLVESFGVIHHMAEPQRGLEQLARRLRPGGLMRLGLYSELARQGVVAARRLITERGYPADADGVRAARREIMTAPALAPDLAHLLSPASDFWTTSDCRDLIFHVQEHRFTLLQIEDMIAQAGLRFLGLECRRAADRLRFQAECPDPASLRSLHDWHAFEERRPYTFGETYCLWLRA